MKPIVLFNLLLALALGLVPKATALRLDFARIEGAFVRFDGTNPTDGLGTFRFSPPFPANQFIVTESDGTGSARALQGRIDGTFCIGVITMDASRETAPVLGVGRLRIRDFAGHELAATLEWERITINGLAGNGPHVLNPEAVLNFTSIRYDGQVVDLVTLASAGVAQLTVGFDFAPRRDLIMLTQDGAVNTTGFIGRIVTIPEPATWALWGLGMAGLACGVRRKAKSHQARTFS